MNTKSNSRTPVYTISIAANDRTPTILWVGFGVFSKMVATFNHVGKSFNTLRPRQNGHHFADDAFKRIFLNENVGISIKISLKFVPKGPVYNIPALVQVMAWRRPDKPLSEPMVVKLLTHICVTRPQWVNLFMGCLNNPIYSNLRLCAACWAHFMCHHELWPTSVSHLFSFLNNSLGFVGGKHY